MRSYLQALSRIREVAPLLEPRLYQTHSMRSFWSLLLPWPGVAFAFYMVWAIAVLVIAIQCWRHRAPLNLHYSVLLLATVLVAPHLRHFCCLAIGPYKHLRLRSRQRHRCSSISAIHYSCWDQSRDSLTSSYRCSR